VFSTKDRRPFIDGDELRLKLHAYLATVALDKQCEFVRVGGVADHVHLAVRLHSTKSLAKLIEELKTSSSKWMKVQGVPTFAWQRGYGAFSVGPADEASLVRYIDHQEEHHRKQSFQDELRAFLTKYKIVFDEKYVWD
jgi:REP element-mobilizing transposase RayT